MDKVVLFGWLSEVHLRNQTHGVVLPNVPALRMFVEFSNESCWNEFCYQEVLELGNAAGLHFGEYYSRHVDTYILRGTTPAHPILIDSETVEADSSDSGDSRPWSVSYKTGDEVSSSEDSSPASNGAGNESALLDGSSTEATSVRESASLT